MTDDGSSPTGPGHEESSSDVARPLFEHSEYTVEGDIERLGAAARLIRAGGRQPLHLRILALIVVMASLLMVVVMLAMVLGPLISSVL